MSRSSNAGERQSLLAEHEVTGSQSINVLPNVTRKKYSKRCVKCCSVVLIILAVVFGAAAISFGVSYGAINSELKRIVASKVALVKGSILIDTWSSPTAPVLLKLWMFNLTNKDEFMNGGKPNFSEIGPFIYKENTTRFDLVWNSDETILRYNDSCIYTYDKELSIDLDPTKTNITTLNTILMGLLVQFQKLEQLAKETNNNILKLLLDDILKGFDEALRNEFKENLFMTRSMDEVIWGYNDPFLKFVNDLNLPIPGLPKNGYFQIIERQAYTVPNMIYTGKDNPAATGSYIMWNGETSLPKWGTPYARMINGTQAVLFHPGIDRSENLTMYVENLFRSIYLSYYQDVEQFGVKMYQYRLPMDILSSKTSDKGFNLNGPDGVFNLSAVYPLNIPVFVSKPHFLDAPAYNYVNSMHPNKTIHDTYLNVEPITGIVPFAAKRIQMNVELKRNADIKEFSTLQNLTYFPLFWIEEGGQMNSSAADEFKSKVYLVFNAVDGSVIAIASVGGFISLVCLCSLLITAICAYSWTKKFTNNN